MKTHVLMFAMGVALPALPTTARSATTTDAPFCMLKGDQLLRINKQSVGRPSAKALRALEQLHRCDRKVDVVVRRAGAIAAYTCKLAGYEQCENAPAMDPIETSAL